MKVLGSVVNSAIFKSPSASSLVASPSPQNFKVTSPSASPSPHVRSPSPQHFKVTSPSSSPLLSTQDRVVINMVADYSMFTNL